MAMPDNINRTFICSVVFLDIVEYSRRSVTEQLKLKEQFNNTLSEAISGVAVDDRIILDTGDGAAVSFLGDPEDAMFVALSMRDAVASQPAETPLLQVRFGINLGPVRLIKDINGQPNIIGDGINVAQRIMTFADSGQILVSRSYYDIIARLSEDYANLFHYEGARTDKHVREHEVYAVGAAPRLLRSRAQHAPRPKAGVTLASLHPAKLAAALSVNAKLLIVAPLTFVFIVGSAFAVRNYRKSEQASAALVTAPARTVPTRQDPPTKVAVAEQTTPAPTQSDAPKAVVAPPSAEPKPKPVKRAKSTPKTSGDPQTGARQTAPTVVASREPSSSASASSAREAALVSLVAIPWADVYVDGHKVGVSPPLRSVSLSPGKHKIELRNASSSYQESVTVKSGERVTVRHRF
jgi:class 3 adenylate cyclase